MMKDLPSLLAGTLMLLVFGVLVTGAQSGDAPESREPAAVNARPSPSPQPGQPLVAWAGEVPRGQDGRHLRP